MSTRLLKHHLAFHTGCLQITLINERLNEAHRIFSTDVIINCCWQKQSLVAVAALYMLHASKYSRFFQHVGCFSLGAAYSDQRFHTVWVVFETPPGRCSPGH